MTINYESEYALLTKLIPPLGKIADRLIADVDENANWPEALLFSKVASTSLSIWRLLPKGEEPDSRQPADAGSIASLTRAVFEACSLLVSMCGAHLTPERQLFQRDVVTIYLLVQQKRFGKALDLSPVEIEWINGLIRSKKEQVRQDPCFEALPKEDKKAILKGDRPTPESRRQVLLHVGANDPLLTSLYSLLSSYTHVLPLTEWLSVPGEYGFDLPENRETLGRILYLLNFFLGFCVVLVWEAPYAVGETINERTYEAAQKLKNRFVFRKA